MVTIIGAGLAGSILKRLLDQNKIENQIIDCEKLWRASPISENLFSMSWANTLGHGVLTKGIKTLERVSNISSIHFKTSAGYNDVMHVHANQILINKYINDEVVIDKQGEVFSCAGRKYASDVTVDCRGFWASINNNKMVGLTGQGIFIKGTLKQEPVMNFVAPYVHQKLFQWDDKTIWYGDSTCVDYYKYISMKDFYVRRCFDRLNNVLDQSSLRSEVVHGIRPWIKGQKGFLKLGKKLITNTGGWKCGLIIYSEQAARILKHIQNL